MATDDVRYQVFVSSTYTDLIAERQAVMSALLQLGAMPAGMELFPAADDEAWTLIKRVIDESDYYLLVIGGRYGSTALDGLSYTEMEYDYAVDQGKPVMAFLHGEPGLIHVKTTDVKPEARERLDAFRKRVEKAKHVKFWTSPEDLAGKVALTFGTFTRTYPAVGWRRGDAGDSTETLKRLAAAQDRIAQLEGVLGAQAAGPPPGAEGLANGTEVLEMLADARIQIKNLARNQNNIDPYQEYQPDASLSWDDILYALGPSMLNEARESALEEGFDRALALYNAQDGRQEILDWLKSLENLKTTPAAAEPEFQLLKFESSHDDFETALLQLQALGLITQSDRRRPVSDRATYWTLTPWGRTRLTQLRAVRAGQTRPPDEQHEEGQPDN
jgi:hypothetical protein